MEAFELIKQNSIAILESEEYRTTEESYSRSMIDILEDYNEVESVTVGHYSMQSSGKELWKINAFSVNEEDEDYQLDLFIVKYTEENESDTIHTQEVNILKNKIKRFLKWSLEGRADNIQEHSIIYQLCKDIHDKKQKISKVDLYVLTNLKFPKIERLVGHDELNKIDLNFHFWDIKRFEKLLSSNSERSTIDINFEEYTGETLDAISINKSDKYGCILTVFPGSMLSDLYRDYDTRLLESNVRVFLQQTGKVNIGIRDTIRNKPEMFLPYNNGISATCANAEFTDGKLKSVTDLQIVNGGQTTASLYYTRKKYNSDLDNVDVQVKITLIPDKRIKEEEVPKISEYANTQNKVSQLDLNSNHPFLVKIEEYSRKVHFRDVDNTNLEKFWFFERVSGAYREALNKEGSTAKKARFKVVYPGGFRYKKVDVARWINLFEGLPHEVSKGGQKSFMLLIYNHAREHIMSVDKNYYLSLIGKGVIFKWFDTSYGRHNTDPVGDTNVKSYVVNYTISQLNMYIGKKLDFLKIAVQQSINPKLYEGTRTLLKHTYDYLVRESRGGLISELAKKKATWDDFKHVKPSVDLKKMFKEYLTSKNQQNINEFDPNDYMINLNSVTNRGSAFWDALINFAKPENSGENLTIHEKQIIERGFNYFFRLRGTMSFSYLKTIINFLEELENKFDVNEILKLSNRADKKYPDLKAVHDKLTSMSEQDLEKVMTSTKVQKSKVKDKYVGAIKSLNLNDFNYNEMTLNELRYLGWAIGVK